MKKLNKYYFAVCHIVNVHGNRGHIQLKFTINMDKFFDTAYVQKKAIDFLKPRKILDCYLISFTKISGAEYDNLGLCYGDYDLHYYE